MTPIPSEAPDEVLAFNAWVADQTRHAPPLRKVGAAAGRKAREEGKSILGRPRLSTRASVRTIDGPDGPITLRTIQPEGREPGGIFLHIHGGGWTWGGPHHHDPLMESLADQTGLVTVSTSYRLAPEHPYPAAPDDCEATALWLLEYGPATFGQELVAIGGESAGGHLTAVTCVRLRDRHGLTPFRAALLTYGCFDLRGTPSMRAFGDQPLILNTSSIDWFVELFGNGHNLEDPGPLPHLGRPGGVARGSLHGGKPRPDAWTTRCSWPARWKAAGNRASLDVWPGGIHAFDLFDNDYGRAARSRMHRFLNAVLGDS